MRTFVFGLVFIVLSLAARSIAADISTKPRPGLESALKGYVQRKLVDPDAQFRNLRWIAEREKVATLCGEVRRKNEGFAAFAAFGYPAGAPVKDMHLDSMICNPKRTDTSFAQQVSDWGCYTHFMREIGCLPGGPVTIEESRAAINGIAKGAKERGK